jgi:hypothetical protein
MDILKQSGKKKHLPVIFYIFMIGAVMNFLWLNYASFFSDFLELIGVKHNWVIRNFLVRCCYPIEWATTLFAIIYYFITKKKVYGFWLMIILSILFIILPVYMFIHNWNSGNPHNIRN